METNSNKGKVFKPISKKLQLLTREAHFIDFLLFKYAKNDQMVRIFDVFLIVRTPVAQCSLANDDSLFERVD